MIETEENKRGVIDPEDGMGSIGMGSGCGGRWDEYGLA